MKCSFKQIILDIFCLHYYCYQKFKNQHQQESSMYHHSPILVNILNQFILDDFHSIHCLLPALGGDIHFDDINLEKSYSPLKSYGQSKLANILFTKELANRLKGKLIFIISIVFYY